MYRIDEFAITLPINSVTLSVRDISLSLNFASKGAVQILRHSLALHHPIGCHFAAKPDERGDFIEVVTEVPPEDRLVVGDAVPQAANVFKVRVNLLPQLDQGSWTTVLVGSRLGSTLRR